MRIGRDGSSDWLILRKDDRGFYISIRFSRSHRIYAAVGPKYNNQWGIR